ncbi:hypothetical protein J6590_019233 [Homalodisca vitripennis]|nr:hypothetical protein J6590_019233 [Homalodisca vitripennis]
MQDEVTVRTNIELSRAVLCEYYGKLAPNVSLANKRPVPQLLVAPACSVAHPPVHVLINRNPFLTGEKPLAHSRAASSATHNAATLLHPIPPRHSYYCCKMGCERRNDLSETEMERVHSRMLK